MALRVALVGAVLLLAGCLSPDASTLDEADPVAQGDTVEAPAADVFEIDFGMLLAFRTPVIGFNIIPSGNVEDAQFPVRTGATHIDATVEWTCAGGVICPIELVLRPIGGETAASVSSQSGSAGITAPSPTPGTWEARTFSPGPASASADIQGTITVEVNYGEGEHPHD